MIKNKLFSWSLILVCLGLMPAGIGYTQSLTEKATLPAGTVLRLSLSARTPIGHIGQPVEATVVEPVYIFDRQVIPAKTRVMGSVTALNPVPFRERFLAMTGGDFTPIRDPEIEFDRLLTPEGETIKISTAASNRNTRIVEIRDRRTKGPSLFSNAKNMARDMAKERLGFGDGPSRMDLARNELWSFLPYHPQALDRGSLLDAELTEPLELELPENEPVDRSHLGEPMPPDTLLHARLLTEMNSQESKKGMLIEAVLTQPVFGMNHELLFPEGTRLLGEVLKAKPAGWFGHSGELRFIFRSLLLPTGVEKRIQAQVEALETSKYANITLDAEGGTRARMNNRFLSPIINAALASVATSNPGKRRLKRAVVSDGFKLVGRIAGYAGTQEISTAFSYYGMARSIYLNFVQRGPDAGFPVNTRLEIRVTPRSTEP